MRQFGRQAQGKEAAALQSGRIHPRRVDTVVLLEFLEQGPGEADIVAAAQVGHVEADVPVVLDAQRVDHDEAVAVGGPVHAGVEHLLGHRHAAAVEVEHDRVGLLWVGVVGGGRVDGVAAFFVLVHQRGPLGEGAAADAGQDQQGDQDFFHWMLPGEWSTQPKGEAVKSR